MAEHTVGAGYGDALLAPIGIGPGDRPRGRPELRQLSDVLFNLYSTSIPPSAR